MNVGKTFTVVTASPDRADLYEVRASWDGTTQRKYVVYHQSILVVFEWDEKFSKPRIRRAPRPISVFTIWAAKSFHANRHKKSPVLCCI